MDGSLGRIVPRGAEIKKRNPVSFCFLEGPVWCEKRRTLFFSDPLAQTVNALTSGGGFSTVCRNTGYVNGMCLNPEGNLVVCRMETGSLEEIDPDTGKTLRVVSSGYNGRPFNATNDVIYDGAGGFYVTDPFFTYGPRTQEIEATYHVAPDGGTKRVASESLKPNGLALSADGRTLFIDDTASSKVWRYQVEKDGSLANPEVFCSIQPPESLNLPTVQKFGEADGLKVDSEGNVYIATFNGIQVFDAAGGMVCTIRMPGDETAANIAFGGPGRTTLYITARTSLYSVPVLIPGLG
jgi:gluconolactonase